MLFSLVYFGLGRLLQTLALTERNDPARDIELLVLRHQLEVLSRQVGRASFRRRDRLLLAAASRLLPRERWDVFLVKPRTLLRFTSRAGPSQVDVPASLGARQTQARRWNRGTHPTTGQRESPMGLPEGSGRAAEAGHRSLSHGHPHDRPPRRSRPRASPGRSHWRRFLGQQAAAILACDFFTVPDREALRPCLCSSSSNCPRDVSTSPG